MACVQGTPPSNLCENYNSNLYTGQTCCVNVNCNSTNGCTNDRCVGVSAGQSCSIDEQCIPGYYCDTSLFVCLIAVTNNCQRDNMCNIGSGCNNTACIKLHSLDNNQYAERSIFCMTGFLYKGKCDAIQAYVNGVVLDNTLACSLSSVCEYYTVNGKELYGTSQCLCSGVSGVTTGYCGVYAKYSNDVKPFYAALAYSTSYCSGKYSHTDDPSTLLTCGSIKDSHYEYGSIMLNRYNYFNLYQSHAIDHCARPLGLFEPWYDPSTFSFQMNLAMDLIALILISM